MLWLVLAYVMAGSSLCYGWFAGIGLCYDFTYLRIQVFQVIVIFIITVARENPNIEEHNYKKMKIFVISKSLVISENLRCTAGNNTIFQSYNRLE